MARIGSFARIRRWWWRVQHSRVLRRRLFFRGAVIMTLVVLIASCLVTLHTAWEMQRAWGETRTVYRFTSDFNAGQTITRHDIELVDMPVVLVPPTAVEELALPQRVITRVARGEFVTWERLSHGESDSLTQLVPYGHSIVTISFSAPSMVINPGDVVSLYDTSRAASGIWGGPIEPLTPTSVDDDFDELVPQPAASKLAERIADSLTVVHVDDEQAQLIVSVPNEDLAVVAGVVASGQFMVVPHGAGTPHCRDDTNC